MPHTLPITYSNDVKQALENEAPVVALESTIITHGMPPPQNLETAREVEALVRSHGAVPATIAVLSGQLHVGLDEEALNQLAHAQDVMKLSRADIAFAVGAGRTGSTTVAATMMVAHQAGIRVFATGGIGGVHRGAETHFDVSADLDELARTPVCVVSAGAKALLDLPKTLEVLETKGVPVIGYQTDAFPAFWSRSSGFEAPLRLDDVAAIAHILSIRDGWPGHGGELIANPVPKVAEIESGLIAPLIEAALDEAQASGVIGKEVTPYVLAKIYEATAGKSLVTNIALIKHNAELAAQIAVAYSEHPSVMSRATAL